MVVGEVEFVNRDRVVIGQESLQVTVRRVPQERAGGERGAGSRGQGVTPMYSRPL